MASPTARTLELLRRSQYTATVCEQWLRHVDRRRDLFGIGDVIAVSGTREPKVLLVQCTSLGNLSSRVKKVCSSPALPALLSAGVGVQCWGWKGSEVKVVLITPEMQAVTIRQPRRRQPQRHEQGTLSFEE